MRHLSIMRKNKIPVRQILPAAREQVSQERFTIRRIADVLGGEDLYHDLHRHDFVFILAIDEGSGTHEIDFISHPVHNHSVFFVRPGQVHQLQLKAGSTGYLIGFNPEFYHPAGKASTQWFRKASNKSACQMDTGNFEQLQATLTNIYREYTGKQEGYQEIIKANLEIFLIELVRQSRNSETSSSGQLYSQERFEEFLNLLETHITNHKRVSQYTGMMNLSAFQLNEITKTAVGKTASELINEYIILEAKRYLLATTNQVKEIADRIGYEDVSYFIRFFKKHTGYSPELFRNNYG